MHKINFPNYTLFLKIFDTLMIPIMYLVSGFDKSWMQQTHGWHMHDVDIELIDKSLVAEGLIDRDTKFKGGKGFFSNFGLFHIPIFGGWKKYMVFEVDKTDYKSHWFVGWIANIDHNNQMQKIYAEINNKPIKNSSVRLLQGPNQTKFFAINDDFIQIPLKKIDTGTKGDNKYSEVALY